MKLRGSILCVLCIGCPWLPAQENVRDGATLYFVPGLESADNYGRQLAVLGDVDGDGVKDFATSGKTTSGLVPEPATFLGRVDLLSGRTGALIRRWLGQREYRDLGSALGALPDIDGDGILELGACESLGELWVFSPVTGETWYTIPQHDPADIIGAAAFLRLADSDGDSVEEFLYVDTFARTDYSDDPLVGNVVAGRLLKVSGRTGEVLWERVNDPSVGSIFTAASPAGDWSGDGAEDLLVPSWPEDPETQGSPLLLLDGRSGELLDTLHVRDDFKSWGRRLLSLDDHDGNGYPEVLVAAPFVDRQPDDEIGWIGLYHLPDFRLLWSSFGRHPRLETYNRGDAYGYGLSPAGDLDGDSIQDVLATTRRTVSPGHRDYHSMTRYGRLYVHSGRTGEVLVVYEANHDLFEEGFTGWELNKPFFETVSPLDDVDGDGHLDFLVGRPSNSRSYVGIHDKGIVRAIRYRPDRPRFIRGDTNGDGRVNITDVATLFRGLFAGGPLGCAMAADADGGGEISLSDGIYLLDYIFQSHVNEPAPPFPECARYDVVHAYIDLGCEDQGSCSSP